LRTSSDQRLKLSISLAAQILGDVLSGSWKYQPACETLAPHEPTCITASSSSFSVAFDILRRPSDEPERTRDGDDVEGWNDIVVISSECVEECTRNGAAGWRGSLQTKRVWQGKGKKVKKTYQYMMKASTP
jgi:hypothetical protein